MTTLNGQDLFGSGPSAVELGAWERALDRRAFPGIDGELVLDFGLRSRPIVQTGRLEAATADDLHTQIALIETFLDGQTHVLVDNHGRTCGSVILEQFEPTTPVRRGRGFWCEYRVVYRQLP